MPELILISIAFFQGQSVNELSVNGLSASSVCMCSINNDNDNDIYTDI